MNHTAILNSSDIKGISNIEAILQEFINDGLFIKFKPLSTDEYLTKKEISYIEKVYGQPRRVDAIKDGEGYLIYLSLTFEEDWNYLARSVKAHDRIKSHDGVRYKLEYSMQGGFKLRYYDYCKGIKKDVLRIYDDTATCAFIEYCIHNPNTTIKLDDINHVGSKNIAQIISGLKMPKAIRDLFFHGITRKTVYSTPRVKDKHAISYDEEAMQYIKDAEKI